MARKALRNAATACRLAGESAGSPAVAAGYLEGAVRQIAQAAAALDGDAGAALLACVGDSLRDHAEQMRRDLGAR